MADTQERGSVPDPTAYKLPATVRPERYALRLTPNLAAFTFTGEEVIAITIRERCDEIVLNAIELAIHSSVITSAEGERYTGTVSLDAAYERATLHFSTMLEPGAWTLQLTFSGMLNAKLHGFYRSRYRDASGQEKVLACTQFESTDARRAFPCWDEPAFKAVFQTTLVVDERLTAISNSRIVCETVLLGTGKKEVVFADTIKMSTYLVAFIVGELEATAPTFVDGKPLRIWAVPGKCHLAKFAQAIGAASLAFFSRYYGREYPGDKLDLIAIPDFASGAMENLGAITFRETALLIDEEAAARSELERVADVVAHENAHMWFGDLVTMRWWNGLWLNEAFATFMELLAVDDFKPEWQRWTSFSVSRAAALVVDGLNSTRPIEYPVHLPEEAAGMFDILTYEKGAAVLRMLEQYLGAEVFRRGISHYLKEHEYDNAETTDLWDAIEGSSRQPVRTLMDSWVFQPGYPLISVRTEQQDTVVSQQIFRYLTDGSDTTRRWQVPIVLRAQTASGVETKSLLLTEHEARISLAAAPEWVVVNAGGHGFYRVRYADELLQRLTVGGREHLSAVERFNVVNDTWAAVLAGLVALPSYLALVRGFRDQPDRNMWTVILGSLHYLYRLLAPAQRPRLQALARGVLSPLMTQLGWAPAPAEHELVSQLRGDLIGALGTLDDDPALQSEARQRYAQYEANPKAIDRNLVPALVATVAYGGGHPQYEAFRARCKSAKTPQEEQRYLFALASFRPPELLEKTLAMTLNGEARTQDAPYLMRALLLNTEGRERAWE
ncbi:MAG: M1 family metallopeptidase, partial [Gammaproteobacteria bacterium]